MATLLNKLETLRELRFTLTAIHATKDGNNSVEYKYSGAQTELGAAIERIVKSINESDFMEPSVLLPSAPNDFPEGSEQNPIKCPF